MQLLFSLLTVAVCSANLEPVATTNASQFLSNWTSSSTVKATTVTLQASTSTRLTTSDVASAALLTTRTEETSSSNTTLNTTTARMSNRTQTVPSSELLNVTATSSGLSSNWRKDDFATNPGLVAVMCLFCIVLALSLVVIMVKCFHSPRSNFEKLEDMPMGKVSEESPFAHYSK
ncbi:uncharacterized homolog isoform X2 [Nothobranchius furzeri]